MVSRFSEEAQTSGNKVICGGTPMGAMGEQVPSWYLEAHLPPRKTKDDGRHIVTLISWANLPGQKPKGAFDCHSGPSRLWSWERLGGNDDTLVSEGRIRENQHSPFFSMALVRLGWSLQSILAFLLNNFQWRPQVRAHSFPWVKVHHSVSQGWILS